MTRVTIAGTIDFEGKDVTPILLAAKDMIAAAYEEKGCIHYVWTADVFTPGRVWVYEEWESSEDLIAHLAAPPYADMSAYLHISGMTGADVWKYRIDLKEPIYDGTGTARGDFYTG